MTLNKVLAVLLCAVVAAALAAEWVRKKTVDSLQAQNAALQGRLQQAEAGQRAALAKAATLEAELETVRGDSVLLERLREQMKTNPASPAPLPAGFYVGTNPPVYVPYGTSNPVAQNFFRAVMAGNYDAKSKGHEIFQRTCAACHQRDGMGKDGVAPPLVGSEWALAPGGERLVRIVLNGLTGPITVQGREWNLPMPPWRDVFDDDTVAVVLNYVRSELGANKAPAVTPEVVGAARKVPHPHPETAVELLQISAPGPGVN